MVAPLSLDLSAFSLNMAISQVAFLSVVVKVAAITSTQTREFCQWSASFLSVVPLLSCLHWVQSRCRWLSLHRHSLEDACLF